MLVILVPATVRAQEPVAADGALDRQPIREHTISGREAWIESRRQGFEFYPVIPDTRFILAGVRDGVDVVLKQCSAPGTSCEPKAQVLQGEMIVLAPVCADGCRRSHVFEMFAGRKLAPGWRVLRIELDREPEIWIQRPRTGTDDASFAVQLEAAAGAAGSLSLRRITLEGPAGADWKTAFSRPRAATRTRAE